MVYNGFDSDNYRYFRCTDGNIYKYRNDELAKALFDRRFYEIIPQNYKIREYPKDIPIDLFELIKMQDKIVFDIDESFISFHYKKGEYIIITDFFYNKIYSDDIYKRYLFEPPESFNEYNSNNSMIGTEKCESIESNLNGELTNLGCSLIVNTKNKTNSGIYIFKESKNIIIPCKKGEVWDLLRPDIAMCLLNQSFLNKMVNSAEILGEEKLSLFMDEYKDNVYNKAVRYYKIKDDFHINALWEICDPFVRHFESVNFNYIPATNLVLCKNNKNNFNSNGSIKYISIHYSDNSSDLWIEREILKIADRLPKEEAEKMYEEDNAANELARRMSEAEKYVKQNKSKYNKGRNRLMTPLQFMEQEEEKEKKYLAKRLVKALGNK